MTTVPVPTPGTGGGARATACVAAALTVLLAACGGSAPTDEPVQGAVVRDSAGVRLVTWGAVPSGPWLTLREEARVGRIEGPTETLFSDIPGGRILDDGSFVVVDQGLKEVRRFAPDGTHLSSHGREGEGPGEYVHIRGVGRCRDEGFTVFDLHWGMSHYDGAGGFLDEEPVRITGQQSPYEMACHPSGRLAVTSWGDNLRGQGLYTSMTHLEILGPDGSVAADLGPRIGSERWGTPNGSRPHPAGRATVFAFQGQDLLVTDGTFLGFERWTLEGTLHEVVRIDVSPPDVDSLRVAYRDSTLARAPDAQVRERWSEQVARMEWPERAGFVSALLATDDFILVRESSIGSSGRWLAFTADGRPLGYLPLPGGAVLLDFRDGRALTEERTEDDVPQAVLYSLVEGA